MNKKLLSLVLALVMVLGTFTAVFAETAEVKLTDADAKVQWLIDNKIVEGRKVNANAEDNDLALDKTLTRAEVTKLVVYALGYEDLAKMLDGAIKAFPDVELNHWANGYISVATTQRASVANNRRIVVGYPEGNFLPENNVTYAELATMLVRIVDKDLTDKMEDNAIWATSYMSWAAEAKLLDGLKIEDSSKAISRKDAFVMLYNALYELGKTDYNKVDFGAKMGVVSKLQAGKIQLNQDTKEEYKIDWNTVMTGEYGDDSGWKAFSENSFRPGALVRMIVDKDGVVTHIIQLGYDGQAYNVNNWKNVAKKVVDTYNGKDEEHGYATFGRDGKDNFKTITVDKVEIEINKDTKYFVADKNKNVYKEVKSLSDAFYYTGEKDVQKVYVGYDNFKTWNEAKVIVFGKVEKDFYGNDLVRVLQSTNSLFDVWAQDTKDNRKEYNLRDISVFPGNYKPEKYDVINLAAYSNDVDKALVIDHSEDDVFMIYKINTSKREITLEDKDGFRQEFTLRDTDYFLKEDAKVDAHVQVKFDDDNIEVLSVVPTSVKLKGELKAGIDSKTDVGVVKATYEDGDDETTLIVDRRPQGYNLSAKLTDKELGYLYEGNEVRVNVTTDKYDRNYGTITGITLVKKGEKAAAEDAVLAAKVAVDTAEAKKAEVAPIKADKDAKDAAKVAIDEADTAVEKAEKADFTVGNKAYLADAKTRYEAL